MKKPMQKIRTCLQKTPNALLCALGAVVFLAGFYFLCYRTPLNEVWLPTTMNNDEALYNRQVVSVLTHGGPQGYFGYQESTADIGRYGTWGPLLIWAYALPGLLFGASVNVVLWCNLLLIAVGIAVFARCARLNYWQCIALCGALFSIMLPLRSCVSGASEAMHYMLALLIVGTAAALHRSGKTGWLIACAAACAVETIFRPYALLFWVFPLTAVWQNKRRRAACLGTAAGGFAVSLFAMAKLAAPYFSDGGMDFDGIRLLLQLHPVAAVRYECARAAALLHAAWRDDILPTLHGETTYIGGGCVTFSGKYCTEYGIATTAARMAYAVLHDEKVILPASAELTGEYGEAGLFAGVPCVIGASGVEEVVELPLTDEEKATFHACCEGIRHNMEHLKEI